MKKLVAFICAALIAACAAIADVFPDGGPYTETVDGVTYRYWINNGQLTYMMADFTEISALTGQTLVIPTTLGGCPVTKIEMLTLDGCSAITSLKIPSSVTTIGNSAFARFSSLTSVTIPSSVTTIKPGAFAECSSLTAVTIPSSVTDFAGDAFCGCNSLASIEIAEGNQTYRSIEGVVYSKDGCVLVACPASKIAMTIPETVTTIGVSAFSDCRLLTSVTIPNGVETIGKWAFNGCSSLTSVTIPDSVTTIGQRAFQDCSSLKSVMLSNNLRRLEDGVFASCSSLETITIPSSVTTIGMFAFNDCEVLLTVYVDEGDGDRVKELMRGKGVDVDALTFVELEPSVLPDGGPYTETVDGVTYRYWINNGQLMSMMADFTEISALSGQTLVIPTTLGGCPVTKIGVLTPDGCSAITSLIIPSSVTEIGNSAFARFSSLTSVTIPSSVTTIKPGAFAECSSLTTVTIPSSVTDFAGSAFCGCNSLASIEIAEGNQKYRSIEGVVYSKDGRVLVACPASKIAMTIPETVTTIGGSAFYDCRLLTSVTIPNGVETIGKWAFNGCSSLTSVTIPDSVTTIGQRAFQECSSLKSVMLSNNLRRLEDGVFVSCSSLETITIPACVGGIENGVFSGCSKLASIDVDEDNSSYRSIDGVLYSKNGRELIACPALKTELIIPATVERICEYAFYGCESLRSVTIPSSVTTIRNTAFSGCSSLTSVTIPSSVTKIWNATFSGCSSLTSVTIPESVTTIANDAFSGCSSLISFDVSNDNPTYCSIDGVLYSKDKVTLVACPNARTSITIPDDVTTIGEYAFDGCSALASVTMPGTLTTIGMNAFYGCSALKSVAIPNGVTTIEWQAFYNCSSLTTVMIPSSVTKIGALAFNDCEVLSTVYVDKGEVDRIKGLLRESENPFNMGQPYVDMLTFVEQTNEDPSIEGDSGAEVTGDAEEGFVVKPSEGTTEVVITIPEGVDAEKVTIEVSTAVQSVKANGAKIKVVKGAADITAFLDIPSAVDGVVNLGAAEVKEAIVKEAMDTEKGAVIELSAENPALTTTATKPGLTYTLFEGTTLDSMGSGASKLGDGTAWTPEIKVKGGASAFYSIKVAK